MNENVLYKKEHVQPPQIQLGSPVDFVRNTNLLTYLLTYLNRV